MELGFPNNVVDVLTEELGAVEGVEHVAKRPLNPPDPNMSIGVYALDWIPQGFEIGQYEPVLATYNYALQAFVKHANEEEGILKHTLLSKLVRSMLYRETSIRVRLGALTETSLGIKERTQRWGVRQQRFISNEISGQFLFLSTMELWLETEAVPD